MVISMVDVGEETGQLPEMLLKVADVYDDEVDNSVAALTSMLEPIMIVLLAVIVGNIVIALFMPLIRSSGACRRRPDEMRTGCEDGGAGRRVSGHVGDTCTAPTGFTIVEVLVAMAIILALAGLILATSGYVSNKGARSRAEVEIAAMSSALENYKTDNGAYPSFNSLDARIAVDPTTSTYQGASLFLYEIISGDSDADRQPDPSVPSYFSFKDNLLSPATGNVLYIKDPFGNSYGYSTAGQAGDAAGYNPTFDLWSTAGSTTAAGQAAWIKNW